MGKEKAPRKTKRRATAKRRRVTMWLPVEIADKLGTYATHRKVDLGVIGEEALRPVLAKFYVVDQTSAPVAPPQLVVADGTAAEESAA